MRTVALLVLGLVAGACTSAPAEGPKPTSQRSDPIPLGAPSQAALEGTASSWNAAWQEVPKPPTDLGDTSLAWAGDRFLVVGGRQDGKQGCQKDAFAWSSGGGWTSIAYPPKPTCAPSNTVWTGQEALFIGSYQHTTLAYDPSKDQWRELEPAPVGIQIETFAWTGKALLVWGSSSRKSEPVAFSFDPDRNTWTSIAPPPFSLNLADGAWTGKEFIVFGSQLDNGNHADTRYSVGAAYDPVLDRWRELPPSHLSAQATATGWDGKQLIAWDYEAMSQAFDPQKRTWSKSQQMPMDGSECYPDDVVIREEIFAWFCGQASLWRDGGWIPVTGGPMDVTVHAYDRPFPVYRFMDMAASDSQVFFHATGVTVQDNGTVCYGCKGAPTSYWVLTPSEGPAPCPDPGAGLPTPHLNKETAKAGEGLTLSGMSPTRVNGVDDGPHGAIQVWLGLDPARWTTAQGGDHEPPAPAPGLQDVWWRTEGAIVDCRYSFTVSIPRNAESGRYPIVAVFKTEEGAEPLPTVWVEVVH